MTVNATPFLTTFNPDGATNTFSYGFPVQGANQLAVFMIDNDNADDVTELVTGVDYDADASDFGNPGGGEITLKGAWLDSTNRYDGIIVRQLLKEQQANYRNQQNVKGPPVENSFDLLVMMLQEMQFAIDRSFKFDVNVGDIFLKEILLPADGTIPTWDDTLKQFLMKTASEIAGLFITPGTTVINRLNRWATTDGKELKNTDIEVDDSDNMSGGRSISLDFDSGALAPTEQQAAYLVNVDESLSTGGEIYGYAMIGIDEGSAELYALGVGAGVNAIRQVSGAFGDADSILVLAVDQTAALASGGAGNVTTFVADDDTITTGDAAKYNEIGFLIGTVASGGGIDPLFEYSTGVGTWATFTPSDGTRGFRNSGVVSFDSADLTGWVVGTGAEFLIRITRQRNSLPTTPVLDVVQIVLGTIYSWDKNGDLAVRNIALTGTVDGIDIATDVAANTAKVTYPSADSTKVAFISVTQAVDLDQMETDIGVNNSKLTADETNVIAALDGATVPAVTPQSADSPLMQDQSDSDALVTATWATVFDELAIIADDFISTGQTITSAALLQLGHGLARRGSLVEPNFIQFHIKCTSAENGYSVDDLVMVEMVNSTSSATSRVNGVSWDTTDIFIRFSSATQVFIGSNKGTGASVVFDNSKWDLFVRAIA